MTTEMSGVPRKETAMTFAVIAFIGGVLTIFSPCILPVLPFVLSRADRPFMQSTFPVLVGMALTFAAVATLAAIGGSWVVQANEAGRYAAIGVLAVVGVTLISSRAANVLARPMVALGARLLPTGRNLSSTGSLLLGIATGLLWTPCAGPILGLVLTDAALDGANAGTAASLLAYSSGAASSMAVAILLGGRVLTAIRRSFGVGHRIRQGLGFAVLAGATFIAFGFDTSLFAQVPYASTTGAERALLDAFRVSGANVTITGTGKTGAVMIGGDVHPNYRSNLPVEGHLPSLLGAVGWLNSPPLSPELLRGKVALIDFWTYSCINCIRTVPYVRAWAEKYKDQGLVVIGVHTPEFAFEKNVDNIKKALSRFKISYPVAIDSDYGIWRAFQKNYWPAFYFVDAGGQIRYHQFGEGDYDKAEKVIRELLAEAGSHVSGTAPIAPNARGEEAAPDLGHIRSGETYIGYREASNFASPEYLKDDAAQNYTAGRLGLNAWSLAGNWTVGSEQATLNQASGGITYRFSARDLHLVLGAGAGGKPVRFQVTIDGKPPGEDHGADTDASGNGTVTDTRLYQLVRQAGAVRQRTFDIRFLDPGVQAFVFTFG